MHVAEIRRYPVKSMAGERLSEARLTELGIAGDRIIQVRTRDHRTLTSRSHPALLGHRATTTADGLPLVDGLPWNHPDILAAVQKIGGPGAQLVREESEDRFDILPLLITTDGALAAFGRDPRRLRPNLILGGVEGLAERSWEGARLVIGDVVIQVHDLRARCVMTTFDPDTQIQDRDVLRDIVRRFGGKLGLNCEVLRGGEIRLNQPVELHPPPA